MRDNKVKICLAGAAVLLALVLCGCSGKMPESSDSFFAMDTVVTVKAYGEHAQEAVRAAGERLRELEAMLSVTRAGSDIYRLNHASGEPVTVSRDTADIISRALDVCESAGGALDITIYPVLLEWGFTTSEYRVPDDITLSEALSRTGYGRVVQEGDTVTLPEGFMLDLGSCAKGYAGDALLSRMSEYGISAAIVSIGGNVATIGRKPDGSEMTVGIADPFSPSELLGTVTVSDCSAVTSGGYQRYFTGDDGSTYIHILDPSTGRPADSGLASVTVIGADGLECDALSTAIFVMGTDKALEYHREHPSFDMIIVTDLREVIVTEGVRESFVCLKNGFDVRN